MVIGGAGSLEVAPGVQLVDTPQFPAAYKQIALAHRAAFDILREVNDLELDLLRTCRNDWPRRKERRLPRRHQLTDRQRQRESAISYPDYADAFVGELEQGAHRKSIVTVAYA